MTQACLPRRKVAQGADYEAHSGGDVGGQRRGLRRRVAGAVAQLGDGVGTAPPARRLRAGARGTRARPRRRARRARPARRRAQQLLPRGVGEAARDPLPELGARSLVGAGDAGGRELASSASLRFGEPSWSPVSPPRADRERRRLRRAWRSPGRRRSRGVRPPDLEGLRRAAGEAHLHVADRGHVVPASPSSSRSAGSPARWPAGRRRRSGRTARRWRPGWPAAASWSSSPACQAANSVSQRVWAASPAPPGRATEAAPVAAADAAVAAAGGRRIRRAVAARGQHGARQ